MIEKIVEANLKKMFGTKEGEMQWLLVRESIGGNAGLYEENNEIYPCVAANFYYDEKGRIICFSNRPQTGFHGTFRIAVDIRNALKHKKKRSSFFKIVNIYVKKDTPETAIKVLEESAERYNKLVSEQPNLFTRFNYFLKRFI